MQIESLLVILLSTGLLFVLVLVSAILWVVLTILFKARRAMMKTQSVAGKSLLALKFLRPTYIAAAITAIGSALIPDKRRK